MQPTKRRLTKAIYIGKLQPFGTNVLQLCGHTPYPAERSDNSDGDGFPDAYPSYKGHSAVRVLHNRQDVSPKSRALLALLPTTGDGIGARGSRFQI
jgi:hypothetical protein